MRIPVDIIPDDIFEFYNLADLVHNGSVTVEIRRGMYGLSSSGKLASDDLKPHLQKCGYHECPRTPGFFKHESRPIMFVDQRDGGQAEMHVPPHSTLVPLLGDTAALLSSSMQLGSLFAHFSLI